MSLTKIKKLSKFLIISLLFITIGCIDLYDPGLTAPDLRLVVEGLFTNQNEAHFIQLSRSAAYSDAGNALDNPVNGAEVWLTDQNNTRADASNAGNGRYNFPKNLKGIIGNTYQLHIKLVDGKLYESEPEKMLLPPPIDEVKSEFV